MTGKDPLAWKQKRTPKRGTRRARSWRRIYPGYTFPDTVWTVTGAPYKRIRRDKSRASSRCAAACASGSTRDGWTIWCRN